jgi:glucose/arabinose dehydrogenase
LSIDQPFGNHNGGDIHVGADDTLWISSGDGGSGGDPGNNAQNPANLLGALLRIDPRPAAGRSYRIPADNPFAGGPAGFAPEIWAYGLRNPWRFSIDPATGDLWIGDVGQGRREEIDYEPRGNGGRNYGWRVFEGTRHFTGTDPGGTTFPIHDYGHGTSRCSVTGGVVYRGSDIPDLVSVYLFADFCDGVIRAIRQSGGSVLETARLGPSASGIVAFGTGADGEVHVVTLGGDIFKLVPR